jgi:hypothetical protein
MAAPTSEVELMLKRKNRLAEERKAADFRATEREKREEAAKMRVRAASARSAQIAKMRQTDARRLDAEADRCAGEAARADERARRFALDEELVAVRLAHTEPSAALADSGDSDWTIV